LIGKKDDKLKGHVFHQSDIKESRNLDLSCEITELSGSKKVLEGLTYKNVYASYAHIHFSSCQAVAQNFINRVCSQKLSY